MVPGWSCAKKKRIRDASFSVRMRLPCRTWRTPESSAAQSSQPSSRCGVEAVGLLIRTALGPRGRRTRVSPGEQGHAVEGRRQARVGRQRGQHVPEAAQPSVRFHDVDSPTGLRGARVGDCVVVVLVARDDPPISRSSVTTGTSTPPPSNHPTASWESPPRSGSTRGRRGGGCPVRVGMRRNRAVRSPCSSPRSACESRPLRSRDCRSSTHRTRRSMWGSRSPRRSSAASGVERAGQTHRRGQRHERAARESSPVTKVRRPGRLARQIVAHVPAVLPAASTSSVKSGGSARRRHSLRFGLHRGSPAPRQTRPGPRTGGPCPRCPARITAVPSQQARFRDHENVVGW